MRRKQQLNRAPSSSAGSVPASRTGRALWVTVAIVFLAICAVGLWVWVRTRAGEGLGAGWWQHRLIAPAGAGGSGATPPFPGEVPEEGSIPLADAANGAALDASASLAGAPTAVGGWLVRKSEDACETEPKSESESDSEFDSDSEPETTAKNPLVYHRKRNDRMEIALSFDDGPHPYYTPVILDILAEYGIHATFFMVGENVTYYTAAAEAVAEAGHEIGNHTFSHRTFNRMNEHEMLDEITACEEAIASIAESRPQFIRPPEGEMSEAMRRVIGTLDYRIVLWDVDTRDWAHTPPETICRNILDTVEAGDIILMHDFIGHDSPTPEALRLVIPALLARGYHFVTVGELVDGE